MVQDSESCREQNLIQLDVNIASNLMNYMTYKKNHPNNQYVVWLYKKDV